MISILQHERAVIFKNWSWVLGIATRYLLNRLLARLSGHWLVQLALHLDLRALEQRCAPYHHLHGAGAPARHTVPRLLRVLLVKYLHDYSLRQTEEALRRDLLLQWFCGYNLWEEPPDHTIIERFEQWVAQQQARAFFDEVLSQIDAELPQERSRPQLVDSYALQSRAAKVSLVTLLRQVAREVLGALQGAHPLRYTLLQSTLDREALFGEKKEDRRWSEEKVRLAALQKVIGPLLQCREAAYEALCAVPPLPLERASALRVWLERLDKILADELVLEQGEDGSWRVREREKKERGSFRMVSATDPQATLRDHGKDKPVELGYNVSVLTTTTLVREVEVQTGCSPDDQALVPLIESQQEHHDLTPLSVSGDGAFSRGKTHAQVYQATEGHTRLITPPPQYDKRSERFSPYDFALSADGATLTCPNGVSTILHYRAYHADGWVWRFTAQQCRGCPLRGQCRDPQAKPNSHRMVYVSDYRAYVLASCADNLSDAHKALMKLRPQVERIIYCLTNLHGGRQARRFGLPYADFQSRMVATVFNLRQWIRLRARMGKGRLASPVATVTPLWEWRSLPDCVARAA
jgi:hypothetical protein